MSNFADLWPGEQLDAETVDPIRLLDWPLLWAIWRAKVGDSFANEAMDVAVRKRMAEDHMSVLDIAAKLERSSMMLEEWTPDAATATEEEVMASVRALLKPPPEEAS